MEMLSEQDSKIKEVLAKTGPAIVAVSGPSGAGKDYLTDKAIGHFNSIGIPTFGVQMVTERPSRGAVETKICISPEEYTSLQEKGELIGDHVNAVRYGYHIEDIKNSFEDAKKKNGIVIIELNPDKQKNFPLELTEKMKLNLTSWIGVMTTDEQTRINMTERGESEESINKRIAIIHEFFNAMKTNESITMVDNGPDNRKSSHIDFINIIESAILNRKQVI